ncbi:hypothetical protein RDWZM_003983 [Blomia tropicalis]|uniref:Protein sleepless n=1 Tax=Blomia tropicalis TaxID=40697 RepID=A0A9Q0MG88_BLOTA|nr:hypothetical protein RDWZM_003983 [Blomia tropicalis]
MSPLDSHLLLFILLSIIAPLTFAIKCWDCNSMINKGCDDPFEKDYFAMADCSQKHLARFPDKEGHFCRKTIQKVNDQLRIIRGCGYINDTFDTVPPGAKIEEECIRRTGTFSVMIEFCACNSGDGCNHAAIASFSYLSYLIPVALTAILLLR